MHNPDISYKSGLCLIHTWPEFPVFSLLNARICESLKFGCNLKEGMFDPQFGSLEGTGRLGIGPFPLPVRPVFWWQLPLWKPLFCWAAKSWDKQIFERLNGRCFFFWNVFLSEQSVLPEYGKHEKPCRSRLHKFRLHPTSSWSYCPGIQNRR